MREDGLVREVPFHVLGEGRRALVAPVGLFLESLGEDRREVGVHVERLRRLLADVADRLHDRHAPRRIRELPGEELVEDDAERVDVGPEVDVAAVAARLLRAHVRERPLDRADLGHHRGRRHVRVRDAREAEVEDLRARVRDDDVRGLQVAVDHAALVGVVHGLADRDELAQALADLRRARRVAAEVLPYPRGEGLAEDQLHREEVLAVVRAPRFVERRDVRVREPGQSLRLPPEHPQVLLVDEVAGAHDLERDPPARALLLGLVDDPHPALAELSEDAEPADLAR